MKVAIAKFYPDIVFNHHEVTQHFGGEVALRLASGRVITGLRASFDPDGSIDLEGFEGDPTLDQQS